MAQTEDQAEEVQQLQLLISSPGWTRLRTLWLGHLRQVNEVKASVLRSNEQEKGQAVYLQGEADGMTKAMNAALSRINALNIEKQQGE